MLSAILTTVVIIIASISIIAMPLISIIVIPILLTILFIRISKQTKKKNAPNKRYNQKMHTEHKTIYKQKDNAYNTIPYVKKKYIFTNNEFAFYKNLKIVADKYDLEVFSKVRLADLVDTVKNKDFYKWFNKVKAKHIDFVLLDSQTMIPLVLIELDDITHDRYDRMKRDEFVDNVCKTCGIKIIHFRNYNINIIEEALIKTNIINRPKQSELSTDVIFQNYIDIPDN